MKKVSYLLFLATASLLVSTSSCKKDECHECHYEDANDNEVELGEKCGDELEKLEADGYTDSDGVVHEVHCHEH